jgi:hypothetical protein
MVLENENPSLYDRSDFNPAGALAAARVMPSWLATRIFPFGFCLRRTLVSKIGYNRKADEVIESAFTTISDVTSYRPSGFVLTSRKVCGFIYSSNRVYSRLELLVAAAFVDAWVADDQSISRSEENKWFGGLKAGMFLDGEMLYMLDYPFWSQNWQDRLRQHKLVLPCANPVVILYAEKAREPLAPGTRIRPFPWSRTFTRGVSSGLKSEFLRFVNDPFYCRTTHWSKGVFLDAQQEPEA